MISRDVMLQVAERVRNDAVAAMRANDQIATGKTAARVRPAATEDAAQVYGPAHLGALEYGVSPSKVYRFPGKAYVKAITEWAEAKNIALKPGQAYGIARAILLRGTRLYRGTDPRFTGKPRTFSGLFTPQYLGAIRVMLGNGARPAITSEVLNALKF